MQKYLDRNNMFFSIITATYNASHTIKEAIQSLQGQAFQDYEHIIIDGASTDNTVTIVDDLRDQRTCILTEPDQGMYDALNKGIRMAKGNVIGFLHADDIYASEDVLKKVYDVFQMNNTDSVYGDLQYVLKENKNKVLRHWKSEAYHRDKLKKGWMPPHPTFFVKKKVYDTYGSFDTSMSIAADYEIMMRFLGKHAIHSVYLPEVLVRMKTGGASNRSLKNIIIKSYEDYKAIRRYNIGGIQTLLFKNLSKIKQFF